MKKDRIPELHFYEWSVSRWASSTTRVLLDSSGRGIYRELIDLCYTQGSCPKDASIQARFCGCTREEVERVWPLISKHFYADKHDHGRLKNAVADVYRESYFGFCKRQKRNRAGASKSVPQKSNDGIDLDDSGQESSDHVSHTKLNDTIRDDKRRDETTQESGVLSFVAPISESDLVMETARRLCARHPKERSCGPAEAAKHLKAIIAKLPKSERAAKLEFIDRNHQGWCESEKWTKDGGEYAKGLANWLAPTMGRYDLEPPARAAPASTGSKSTDAVLELAKRNFERTGRIFG